MTAVAAKPGKPRLVTIPFSHYCEKARWALDHARVEYDEAPYLPGFHVPPMRAAGGRTVPVLVTPAETLNDSADIVLYADARATRERKLYPEDAGERADVLAIEATCNRDLGVATRLVAYHHGLTNRAALARLASPGLTRGQARLLPWVFLAVRPLIRRRYGVTPAAAGEALESVRRIFAALSERLAGRRWLVGDRFTAADLTFASLASPLVLPEGHPSFRSDVDAVASEMGDAARWLRATAAGQHVMRMYREERRRGGASGGAK